MSKTQTKTKVPPTYEGDPGDEHQERPQVESQQEQQQEEPIKGRVQVGLSPLGGVGLNVYDENGVEAGISLSIEEAEQLGARLIGLTGMLVHVGYMEMARQQAEFQKVADQLASKKIHLPR